MCTCGPSFCMIFPEKLKHLFLDNLCPCSRGPGATVRHYLHDCPTRAGAQPGLTNFLPLMLPAYSWRKITQNLQWSRQSSYIGVCESSARGFAESRVKKLVALWTGSGLMSVLACWYEMSMPCLSPHPPGSCHNLSPAWLLQHQPLAKEHFAVEGVGLAGVYSQVRQSEVPGSEGPTCMLSMESPLHWPPLPPLLHALCRPGSRQA